MDHAVRWGSKLVRHPHPADDCSPRIASRHSMRFTPGGNLRSGKT